MGLAGNVYAFDLRFQGGVLVGELDEVQPSPQAVGEVINLRWDTISNSCSLLNDVAYVELPPGYEKLPRQRQVSLGSLGEGERYFWDHTLRGYASAIILLLPRDWTLSRDVMPPISCSAPGLVRISAKNHKGRIAVLFIVEASSVHNLRTAWQIAKFNGPISAEVQWINGLSAAQEIPIHIRVDQSSDGSPGVQVDSWKRYVWSHFRRHRFLWIVACLVLVTVAFLWLAGRRLVPGIDEIPSDLRSEYVGPKPHQKPVVVVFVHGIFGSKNDTWVNKGESFPVLLATDPSLQANTDVFLYEYFTPKLSAAGSIVELADQLRGALQDHGVFRDHKRVVFLSHSMGGLIVRQFVTSNTDKIPQVAMFYFYATPTDGAELTAIAHRFSGNPQLRGMVPLQDNDLLQSIQQRWIGVASLMQIPSYCAYETLPTVGVYVVSQASARGLCNKPLDPITADHINIVKPPDRDDPRYARFVTALQESVPEAFVPAPQESNAVSPGVLSDASDISAEEADRRGTQLWIGENPNYAQAFKYFTIAAAKGYPVAFGHLGWMYELGLLPTGSNCVKAMELYKKAYDKGAINSSWNIGRLYDTGCGVKQDNHLARCWYEKAQANGLPEATRDLNNMKQQGRIDSDPCPPI
jgi:pimeloyl-ACP methyl ester carboxylesterase